ncbi:glycoside hydrolase family 16 protein [Diaporthe amygdali]|uniref:glycoside hydrolase family 16 protein n=1 Tax=Phomopsis amygdali TaxID=1214568 RepID=UPI0022FE294C|nr:glycoside hydrolase family 16 protein [Diaporthe amygdali]KAJ0109544.1 glycoside hydrolase family 16 protein [Diaporthe amygdali]
MWPSKPSIATTRIGRTVLWLASAILLSQHALADCECGYSTSVSNTTDTQQQQQQSFVFTDLIEANFANVSDISKNTDWVRQEFNTSATQARGTYGEMFAVDNVEAREGGDGLQITVRSDVVEDMLSGGEIDSARLDVFYGSFRSSLKLTDVGGTVSAFFWYFNDTQEIDMEFLSKDFRTENSSYPVNLVLQSPAAAQAGFDASGTDSHKVVYLPFNPSADFHEYRFDFVPGRVAFYADGAVLAVMNDPAAVPTTAGHLSLNQWSNGNALWSGGPPAEDAVMDVRYVKAYFNSSLKARQGDYAARCKDPAAAGAVCAIPAVTADNDSAAGYFFTGQKNMTDNQTVSSDNGVSGGDENGAIGRLGLQYFTWMWVAVSVLMTGCGVLL